MSNVNPHRNLLASPVLLPVDPATDRLTAGDPAVEVAAQHPTCSAAWAALAEAALVADHPVEAYAYARTGYHRGLDALRRAGWKGNGPVPWSHTPNQGVLRSIYALAQAAKHINEADEEQRCLDLLEDADPEALRALGA